MSSLYINLHHRYSKLGAPFIVPVSPTPLELQAYYVHVNHQLATKLAIKALGNDFWLKVISGGLTLKEYQAVASLYAGHQFGIWVDELGDGRAMLIAEHQDMRGIIWELQLKGAGTTPFSRMGDGRAVLRSSIREYLCSHAIEHLNIPTTQALAIVSSKDQVYRESIEDAAIVLRVAQSFIRFGNFEVLASRAQFQELQCLADFVIVSYYPELINTTNKYLDLFKAISHKTAYLVAKWQSVGFCHGVMNTDNMSILGLSLDYGPFAFLDTYTANYVCNHSDRGGRYSYINQPLVSRWNLAALASAFSALIPREQLQQVIDDYMDYYNQQYNSIMGNKLGLADVSYQDGPLLTDLLRLLEDNQIDWTIFWRTLSHYTPDDDKARAKLANLFTDKNGFYLWLEQYHNALNKSQLSTLKRKELMLSSNPKYILRNYLAQLAIEKAQLGDYSEIDKLFNILTKPFDEMPEYEEYAKAPPKWAQQICISCSS